MEKKHHYRAVFKSDHLSSADLEDLIEQKKPLIFTIKEVKQEIGVTVAGKKGNFNIAYFSEAIKPLVLNATNSRMVRNFAGGTPWVEEWKNIAVELYIDEKVKMKGETVSGIRISPVPPQTKAKPQFTKENFEKAKTAGATIAKIKEIYSITPEVEKEYSDFLSAKTEAV